MRHYDSIPTTKAVYPESSVDLTCLPFLGQVILTARHPNARGHAGTTRMSREFRSFSGHLDGKGDGFASALAEPAFGSPPGSCFGIATGQFSARSAGCAVP